MNPKMKLFAATSALLVIAACGQQEEPVVIQEQTPIYGKDGTIIGMRPTVVSGGMDMSSAGAGSTAGASTPATDNPLSDDVGFDGDDSDG